MDRMGVVVGCLCGETKGFGILFSLVELGYYYSLYISKLRLILRLLQKDVLCVVVAS